LVIWDKNRAQVKRKACAFVVSASLGLTGLTSALPVWAQDKGAPALGVATPPPGGAGAPSPNLPSVTNPPIVTPPVATPPVAAPPGDPTPAVPPTNNPPVLNTPAFNLPPLNVPGAAQGTDTAPGAPQLVGRVSRITLIGNSNINGDAIRAVISQTGLRLGEAYAANIADTARDAVKGMGYFNGDIVVTAAADPAGGVDVVYTVKENPIVKTIKFTANTPTGEPTIPATKLKSLMETQEGRVLNTNTLVRDLDKLFNHQTGYVRGQGFIFDVSSDINIDPLTGVLNIPLVEAHINSITVKGNKKTKVVVVMRELRSSVGDVLDEHKLQRDLTRVYNLGLFDEVGPFDENSTDVGKVDITIPVTEKRSGQVSVGVGYSSASKLVGRAELAENNFRGLGERVSLQWEVGGTNSQSSLELGFFEPYLDKKHTSLDVDVYDKAVYRFNSGQFSSGSNTTGDNNTYLERRVGGVLGLNRALSDFLTVGVTGRIENVRTDNLTLQTQDQFIRQDGSVAGLGGRAIFSNRDNEVAPASGGLRSLSYEIVTARTHPANTLAPSPLAPGRENFGKLGLDLRQYMSLQGPRKAGNFNQPKRVLATRLLIGATAHNIPFFEQYFLGGADSLRGYDTDRFWGSNLALFQAELRLPFSNKDNNFQGVLLLDAGDAWNSIYQQQGLQQHTRFQLEADYGVGIRLVTPIGPIRLDYAIPTTGSHAGRTQFSIGQSF
jgi:outer membrane protein insertion porin family